MSTKIIKVLIFIIFISLKLHSQIDYYSNPQGEMTKKDLIERKYNYGFDLKLSFGRNTYISSSVQVVR